MQILGDNTVNDKIYGYFVNHENQTIDTSDYGQIQIVDGYNLTLKGLILQNASHGIAIYFSKNITIEGCDLSYNYVYSANIEGGGVYVKESTNITISNIIVNY